MLNAGTTTGGGAAATIAPTAAERRRIGYTLEELAARTDALALRVGARTTASVLLMACVLVILIGAQSLLGTLKGMDRDIKTMNEQMAIANQGLVILNTTMDSLPSSDRHLGAIITSVTSTSEEVKRSATSIQTMADTTGTLHGDVAAIAESTGSMRGSLQSAASGTGGLATTITDLNKDIEPLVATQHKMLLSTRSMRGGLDRMNASLAYVVRIMNWITAPATGGGLHMRAELPKQTLPPIPGLRAEVKPVQVFERNVWPVYTGP